MMVLLQILLTLVYAIGVAFSIRLLKQKIDNLKTVISSQDTLLKNAERFMKLADPSIAEKYTELYKRNVDLEMEEFKKRTEAHFRAKSEDSFKFLLSEFINTVGFSVKLIATMPSNQHVVKFLGEMKDSIAKTELLNAQITSLEAWEAAFKSANLDSPGGQILKALLSQRK